MKQQDIRHLRKRLGESQTKFGERFGVSQITVAYWESGRSQPARQRLEELSKLDSSSISASPDTLPFRPIQYLGSKQRLARTIATVLNDVAPEGARVGDLFSGSGVVGGLLGANRPITSVDVQCYAQVLSTALLNGREADFALLLTPTFGARSTELAEQMRRLLAPLLRFEEEAIAMAGDGKPENLIELIEFGSIAANTQRQREDAPAHLSKLLRAASEALDLSGLPAVDLIATRYFGGPYFSYRQAIALDATYAAARQLAGGKSLPYAVAVLLSAASELVNTVGKQFAQPMKLRKADGRVPAVLLQRALRDRTLDADAVYRSWGSRWMANALTSSFEHRIVRGDVLSHVEGDRTCGAWYADPPYTIDHYSRFYHVLETLCLRDSPRLDEMTKRGEPAVMRGVYRAGRYQSPYCIPSQAQKAFDRLFTETSKRGAPLVLSYSPFDEGEGDRPRLLSLAEMTETASRHYHRVSVMEVTEHSHRKLNAKHLNVHSRGDAERLIICEAKR